MLKSDHVTFLWCIKKQIMSIKCLRCWIFVILPSRCYSM